MWYDEKNTPWLDGDLWNRTKGEYCEREGISLHFDDTIAYVEYFTTPFARIYTKNDRNGKGNKNKSSAFEDN